MKLLANIVWLLTGGWLIGLLYLVGALVFFPLLPFLYPLIGYGLWPFGRKAIPKSRLEEYQRIVGKADDSASGAAKTIGLIANIRWALTFGWALTLTHIISSRINLIFFWLVITIPNIAGHWKLIPTAFAPLRRVVISSSLADQIDVALEKKSYNL